MMITAGRHGGWWVTTRMTATVIRALRVRYTPIIDAGCRIVWFVGSRKVYPYPAITDLDAIRLIVRYLGVLCTLEVHKTEASGTASLSIEDNGGFADGTKLGENIVQLRLGSVDAKIEHGQHDLP
uniref:Putative secreted protein n=1 Tax=Anopheles marajoara TaxID=58244 RepID=A0A2M4C750_9DIPT